VVPDYIFGFHDSERRAQVKTLKKMMTCLT